MNGAKNSMRKTVFVVFSLLMAGGCAAQKKGTGSPAGEPPLDPNLAIHYIGRFTADAAGPVFEWSNSTIVGYFTGTGVSVTLQEMTPQLTFSDNLPAGNIYQVSVDDQPPRSVVAQPGTTTYDVAVGIPPGPHIVKVVKQTEARVGGTRFLGFKVTGGQFTARPPAASRRILVIGDSISVGYGVLGTDPNCKFSPTTENSAASYGAVAANLLGAELTITAWSAKGVWRNADGNMIDTMPQLALRTLPSDPTSVWDPKAWMPDAVVVNLGTNDFAFGIPPTGVFEQAYSSLLSSLRLTYPSAHIVCGLGPMLSDSVPAGEGQLTKARSSIQSVLQAKADPAIELIEFTGLTVAQQGCGGHPNASFQHAMGQQLAISLQKALRW
jgi:lysophospholipase L1-like esterase